MTHTADAAPRRRVPRVILLIAFLALLAAIGTAALTHLANSTPSQPAAAELAPPPEPVVPAALTSRLDALEKNVKDLVDQVRASIATQEAVQRDVAAIKAKLDQALVPTAAALHREQRPRRIAKVVPVPDSSPPLPEVLSVDSWGGHSSVVLRDADGRVRFAADGDQVHGGVIGSANPATQTVVVRRVDGEVITVTPRETP